MQWLDTALEDKPLETKNRVLEFIIKFGGDLAEDSEFWMLFAAIGYLQTIVLESPQEWRDTFDSFNTELISWSETNVTTLELLVQKAQTTEELSKTSIELMNSVEKLAKLCSVLIKASETSSTQESKSLTSSLKALESSLTSILSDFSQSVSSRLSQIEGQITNSPSPRRGKQWVMVLVGMIAILGMQVYDHLIFRQTSQRVQWILSKQNRRDCLEGIKSQDSAECKNLGL